MFTRILTTLEGALAWAGHASVKYREPDIGVFVNDPAALAYLRTKPTRRRPSADFGLDLRDIW